MKNSNDTIGNRTRDLLACSTVRQPTMPPRAPHILLDPNNFLGTVFQIHGVSALSWMWKTKIDIHTKPQPEWYNCVWMYQIKQKFKKYFTWLFILATYIRWLFQELSANRVKRSAGLLTGAPAPADVSDPYIQEIANTALAEVDSRSNTLYRQKVVRIVEAQKQVCIVLICIVTDGCSIFYCIKIPSVRYSWYFCFMQHWIFNCQWCNAKEWLVKIIYVIKCQCEGHFQGIDIERAKLVQLDSWNL
jgi:hypothetical protein